MVEVNGFRIELVNPMTTTPQQACMVIETSLKNSCGKITNLEIVDHIGFFNSFRNIGIQYLMYLQKVDIVASNFHHFDMESFGLLVNLKELKIDAYRLEAPQDSDTSTFDLFKVQGQVRGSLRKLE